MNPDITFNVTSRSLRHTKSPNLRIKFNLLFHSEYLNYPVRRYFRFGPRRAPPSSHHKTTARANIAPGDWPFGIVAIHGAVQDAVGQAIGDRLCWPDRARVISIAFMEVLVTLRWAKSIRAYHVKFKVDMEIRIRYDYVRESVVPAPASSLRLLKKDEVEEERWCCICLEEEIGSGEARRLPCSHVFHGGCIEEWLRKSHNCPLCRACVSRRVH